MYCAAYTDARLAAVYDALNPPFEDTSFYVALAGDSPKTILDMGSGTGRLACDLGRLGHRVTGVDPAAGMLGIARKREGGEKVGWIEADAAGLAVDTRFDLIIMTGHVFQVFLDDREICAVLGNLRRHLAAGGRLAFETRNPEIREWEQWPLETYEPIHLEDRSVNVHYEIKSVDGSFVTFATHFRFSDEDVVVADHTLRFMDRDELGRFLADAGFGDVVWCGDWDRSPISPGSPEIIVTAR
jgi:SAM-dependent methyltransferase